jgi:hypothetical protein
MRSTDERWELGDEALALEPVGRQGPRGGVVDRLDALAKKRGVAPKTLRTCRGVANAWPKKYRRKSLSWSVHAALRGQPDRFELIKQKDWTVREAQELVESRKRQKA